MLRKAVRKKLIGRVDTKRLTFVTLAIHEMTKKIPSTQAINHNLHSPDVYLHGMNNEISLLEFIQTLVTGYSYSGFSGLYLERLGLWQLKSAGKTSVNQRLSDFKIVISNATNSTTLLEEFYILPGEQICDEDYILRFYKIFLSVFAGPSEFTDSEFHRIGWNSILSQNQQITLLLKFFQWYEIADSKNRFFADYRVLGTTVLQVLEEPSVDDQPVWDKKL